MGKFTGQGKHTIKAGHLSHTKLLGKLKDKTSKIIYIYNKQLRKHKTIRFKI